MWSVRNVGSRFARTAMLSSRSDKTHNWGAVLSVGYTFWVVRNVDSRFARTAKRSSQSDTHGTSGIP